MFPTYRALLHLLSITLHLLRPRILLSLLRGHIGLSFFHFQRCPCSIAASGCCFVVDIASDKVRGSLGKDRGVPVDGGGCEGE